MDWHALWRVVLALLLVRGVIHVFRFHGTSLISRNDALRIRTPFSLWFFGIAVLLTRRPNILSIVFKCSYPKLALSTGEAASSAPPALNPPRQLPHCCFQNQLQKFSRVSVIIDSHDLDAFESRIMHSFFSRYSTFQGGSPTSQNLDAIRSDATLMAARRLFEQAAAVVRIGIGPIPTLFPSRGYDRFKNLLRRH